MTIDEKIKKGIPFEDVESAYINLDAYFAQCLDREDKYKEVLERCFYTALDCMEAVAEIHGKMLNDVDD